MTEAVKRAPEGLVTLIGANEPLWAAEAEVCGAYFTSPARSRRSDLRWLARQAAKELIDGVVPRADDLSRLLESGEGARHADLLARTTEELHEEAAHFAAFIAAYDKLRQEDGDDGPILDLELLTSEVAWPENLALRDARHAHRRQHGKLGELASTLTEGGYCTLFTEGMRLAGREGTDDLIAAACALVYDDEFDHMLSGIAALCDAGLGASEWRLLADLTVEQSRLRVHMRDAQFDHPVEPARIDVLLAGGGSPLRFDWARAGLAPPEMDD
jgi:hypothetical protein